MLGVKIIRGRGLVYLEIMSTIRNLKTKSYLFERTSILETALPYLIDRFLSHLAVFAHGIRLDRRGGSSLDTSLAVGKRRLHLRPGHPLPDVALRKSRIPSESPSPIDSLRIDSPL